LFTYNINGKASRYFTYAALINCGSTAIEHQIENLPLQSVYSPPKYLTPSSINLGRYRSLMVFAHQSWSEKLLKIAIRILRQSLINIAPMNSTKIKKLSATV
jgi:hypothetical protein